MQTSASRSQTADAGAAGAWATFRVAPGAERAELLRRLRDSAATVVLHASDGSSIGTTLMGLDAEHGRLAFHADPRLPQLERLVECDEAVATAYLDNIRVQFELQGFIVVRGDAGCALQCPMPAQMFRFQRRGAFRVQTPQRAGPLARLRHPAIAEMQLGLRVLDLSLSGCALWLPATCRPSSPARTGPRRASSSTW